MMKRRRLRAVNGYMIQRTIVNGERGVKIIYLINGVFFTQSKYPVDIDNETQEKIQEKLEELIEMNRNAEDMYTAVPLTTIVSEVEKIIV